MGADGGTVAVKRRFFRGAKNEEKKQVESANRVQQAEDLATTCHLSNLPLETPVVACQLGYLYNKEAVLQALLDKSIHPEGFFRHLKSSKSLINCEVKINPLFPESSKFKFVCPITNLELNGINSFVVLKSSGKLVSLKAVKEVRSIMDEEKEGFLVLFPNEEEAEVRRRAVEEHYSTERKAKKKKLKL